MGALIGFLIGGGSVLVGVILYWAFFPDKAEKVAGQIVGIFARGFSGLNKSAVAMRVQGSINSARSELLKEAPADLLEEKVKVRWKDTDAAASLLKDGEVLVVMQRAEHHEENLAHAVMSYLPKALLSRGRRYIDPDRMRAVDLVVGRAILDQEGVSQGALPVFFEDHFDPARTGSDSLKGLIDETDEIDLQGWLIRVLLPEYRRLGDQLHPSDPTDQCIKDGEALARFVAGHAMRELGDDSRSRILKTQHFRIAIIYVALRSVVETKGLDPYLKRAKRYLFRDKLDAVYLMAYDKNIEDVGEVADALEQHGWVASVDRFTFALRNDFKKRKNIDRDRAIAVCVRRRQLAVDAAPEEDFEEDETTSEGAGGIEFPEEIFDLADASGRGASETGPNP